ncbi:MAG TPA: prepilin-type N-terminal cleavage/methylation domain-containing protein [Pyrinomonadaceae bacterium]|nr:prepilin-type N-terminal cleavage/methylation domain-containing protein [Pyrinomonadaceae bacterium]
MKQGTPAIAIENSQGFSLLETAIALVIMMVVTLGTAQLYVYATRYNAGSADRAACLALAQQKMERLRWTDFGDSGLLAGTTNENVTYADHHYTMTTTIGGDSTRKVITIQVVPQNQSGWMNTPVTLIGQRATPIIGPYVGP